MKKEIKKASVAEKNKVLLWSLIGFAVTSLGGTLLHYLYEWSGGAAWIAPFSGVNESTWEHMKLLFVPTFLFAIVQSFFFREREDYWCAKLCGTLAGLAAIPMIYYTYNGAMQRSPAWLNIAIFFLAAAVTYLAEIRRFARYDPCRFPKIALFLLCMIALCFAVFTFVPPKLGIFRDPLTGSYGRG